MLDVRQTLPQGSMHQHFHHFVSKPIAGGLSGYSLNTLASEMCRNPGLSWSPILMLLTTGLFNQAGW